MKEKKLFLTSLKQICNECLIKFSGNQSAPKLENRKTSPCFPCAPNLLHVLVSLIPGYHNLCSPVEHISHLQLLRIFKTDNARETKPAFPYLTDYLQSTEHICDLYICQLKLLEPKETKCLLQLPRPVHIIRKLSVCSLETNSNALFSKTSVI